MAFTIDATSYRKDTICALGQGYSMRRAAPSSIVIHTTNNDERNTAFDGEAKFLRTSHDVGAHFLVGKQGQIVQLLSPDLAAWHAGGQQKNGVWTAQPAFDNFHSIGIESHVSVGEPWTTIQHEALTWLVRRLMAQFGIGIQMIETHRAIALPAGRKTDPESWPNASFYAWRASLVPVNPLPTEPITKRYRVREVMISQRQEGGAPYAGVLQPGDEVVVDKWYTNGRVHLQDGRGFVALADLEAV